MSSDDACHTTRQPSCGFVPRDGLPVAPLPLVTPSTPAVLTHGACSRHVYWLLPTPAACLHPSGLGPRGHPIQEHFTRSDEVPRAAMATDADGLKQRGQLMIAAVNG
jgi:hypothetical protein